MPEAFPCNITWLASALICLFELYHTDIELRLTIKKKPNKNGSNLNSPTIKIVVISIRHPIQLHFANAQCAPRAQH